MESTLVQRAAMAVSLSDFEAFKVEVEGRINERLKLFDEAYVLRIQTIETNAAEMRQQLATGEQRIPGAIAMLEQTAEETLKKTKEEFETMQRKHEALYKTTEEAFRNTDAKMAGMDNMQRKYEALCKTTEEAFHNTDTKMAGMDNKVEEMHGKASTKYATMQGAMEAFEQQYQQMREEVESSRTQMELVMSQTNFLHNELQGTNRAYAELHEKTRVTFENLERMMKGSEGEGSQRGGVGGAGRDRKRSYLPMKNMIPRRLGDKMEEWRVWRDDTLDYVDTVNPGMDQFLKALVDFEGEETEDSVYDFMRTYNMKNRTRFDADDSIAMWRLLKRITE